MTRPQLHWQNGELKIGELEIPNLANALLRVWVTAGRATEEHTRMTRLLSLRVNISSLHTNNCAVIGSDVPL